MRVAGAAWLCDLRRLRLSLILGLLIAAPAVARETDLVPIPDLLRLAERAIGVAGETGALTLRRPAERRIVFENRAFRLAWFSADDPGWRLAGDRNLLVLEDGRTLPRCAEGGGEGFWGYADEILVFFSGRAGYQLELLRPARFEDECGELARRFLPALSPQAPPAALAAPEIEIRILSTGGWRRDSHLLGLLFHPLPAGRGFERAWIVFGEAEVEMGMGRFEESRERWRLELRPARRAEAPYFHRAPGLIDYRRTSGTRELSLQLEAVKDLGVSRAELDAWLEATNW